MPELSGGGQRLHSSARDPSMLLRKIPPVFGSSAVDGVQASSARPPPLADRRPFRCGVKLIFVKSRTF